MTDSWIGPGAIVDKSIIDKNVVVGAQAMVGTGTDYDTPNTLQPDKVNTGINVIGKGARIPANSIIGRNVVINAERTESQFPFTNIASGSTI